MIFSKEHFSNDRELQQLLPTSAALSWEKMEAPLRNAQDDFLLPLMGDTMMADIEAIYEKADADRSAADKRILYLAQKAVANIAFWINFDALNLRITDQGFQRQQSESGNWTGAYKYQEDHLRQNFKNTGLNALDGLMSYLEDHISDYNHYNNSPGYVQAQKSIVHGTSEIEEVYDIHDSRIIFLRLQPVIRNVQALVLQPILGDALYQKLLGWLEDSTSFTDAYTDAKFDDFRKSCCRVVVMKAIIQLLRTTGSITDRGLYFTTIQVMSPGNEVKSPVSDVRLDIAIKDAERACDGYVSRLTAYINTYMVADATGSSLHALDRDNTDKAAFWA
jgi:hypothetical protein